MRFPHMLAVIAAILVAALGATALLFDASLRTLRIEIGVQEQQVQASETHLVEQTRALQSLDEQREAQEQSNEILRRKVAQQQAALQAQQEQIAQATQVVQQVGPNLLRDLAAVAGKDEKIRALLIAYGYVNAPR
jgi:Skp family chaperone for outer membrane proteins